MRRHVDFVYVDPARETRSRPARSGAAGRISAEPGKTLANLPYYQIHVKAEFFARGVGWVLVDLSSAVLHDKSPQGLRFFGNDPGDFIAFHVDSNLVVDSQLFGAKSVANLQTPSLWVAERARSRTSRRSRTGK